MAYRTDTGTETDRFFTTSVSVAIRADSEEQAGQMLAKWLRQVQDRAHDDGLILDADGPFSFTESQV